MLRNYLTIALRNLRKHPGYTFLNVTGLAVGLACCLLILLYVHYERSYDRFHDNADRIHRIVLKAKMGDRDINTAVTAGPVGPTMAMTYPEVEAAVRMQPSYSDVLISRGERQFSERHLLFADSSFFDVFSFRLLKGNAATALAAPRQMVLTEATAAKLFGSEDPVGKTVTFNSTDEYTVSGVVQNVPGNSHFRFDYLASYASLPPQQNANWGSNNLYTYVVLREGASAEGLQAKLPELVRNYAAPEFAETTGVPLEQLLAQGFNYGYYLQPLTDIHLYSTVANDLEPQAQASYLVVLIAIAIFILLLACVNFMNLATARSARRAKEVGVRKVLGSNRKQIVGQFLSEAVLMAVLALGLGLTLASLALPGFNALTGEVLTMALMQQPLMIAALVLLTLTVGLLAGGYPAFFLSNFQPVRVLKGSGGRVNAKSRLRQGLVVFQFAVAITLLVGTVVVAQQLQFLSNQRLGFDKENVVMIQRARALGPQRTAFQDEVRQLSGVASVAATNFLISESPDQNGFHKEDAPREETLVIGTVGTDYGFEEALGLNLVAGRSFSRDVPGDSAVAVLNETAVRAFGWEGQDVIGKQVQPMGSFPRTVIGVVEDYHLESLHLTIKPLMHYLHPAPRYIAVRVRPGDVPGTLAQLEQAWQRYVPSQPFTYAFLDDELGALYEADQQAGRIFGTFAGLAVLIACLGLFGLAAFTAEQRTKEIGVRKVLGASEVSLVALLGREFAVLVLVALAVAAPIGYFAMQQWLGNFAYHVEVGAGAFLLAGGLALAVALLTVGYHAIRAARTNPVTALRYE